MAKEYEKKTTVVSIDQAPPGDALTDDFTNVVAWYKSTESAGANALATDSTHAFSGSKCMKITYTSVLLTDHFVFYRDFPFSSQNHINFEFAIGVDRGLTRGNVAFVVGHTNNAGACSFMKFKILAWGTLSSTLQYWRASDNTWVSFGTLELGLTESIQFITISGKFNIANGLFEELRIGAQRFTFTNVALEGDSSVIFGDLFTVIGYNTGTFGIEVDQSPATIAKEWYVDRFRMFGSSV